MESRNAMLRSVDPGVRPSRGQVIILSFDRPRRGAQEVGMARHAQARSPRGVLSGQQSLQRSAPRLPNRGGPDRVRDLPFRGVREVGFCAARVCDHGQPPPPRGGDVGW